MLDWLIIGGGIHGTAISHGLTQRAGVPRDRLRVLDPYDKPLARWTACAINTGMDYLRSPLAHQLHFDPFSLRFFAQIQRGKPLARFIPQYSRPAFDFFQAHSAWLIEHYHLDALRITGRAVGLTRIRDGWRVETSDGGLEARRVVLAMGATEQPYWPAWAINLRNAGAHIHHIFDMGFAREDLHPWSNATIIGGGITAAQTALTMTDQQPGTVQLVMRYPVRIAHFDSDPCWVTSICLKQFHQGRDYDRRRAIIKQARNRGSMPPEVAARLSDAVQNGLLEQKIDEVENGIVDEDGQIHLNLRDGVSLKTDLVILATGFDPVRPGGRWVDNMVAEYELPRAACGYPIVDELLCWSPKLYVSGPLAELEIGPVSRNIIGARLAAERLRSV
jgi:cation diffusion facilitator CzcD-associated flavoprotein CzcO